MKIPAKFSSHLSQISMPFDSSTKVEGMKPLSYPALSIFLEQLKQYPNVSADDANADSNPIVIIHRFVKSANEMIERVQTIANPALHDEDVQFLKRIFSEEYAKDAIYSAKNRVFGDDNRDVSSVYREIMEGFAIKFTGGDNPNIFANGIDKEYDALLGSDLSLSLLVKYSDRIIAEFVHHFYSYRIEETDAKIYGKEHYELLTSLPMNEDGSYGKERSLQYEDNKPVSMMFDTMIKTLRRLQYSLDYDEAMQRYTAQTNPKASHGISIGDYLNKRYPLVESMYRTYVKFTEDLKKSGSALQQEIVNLHKQIENFSKRTSWIFVYLSPENRQKFEPIKQAILEIIAKQNNNPTSSVEIDFKFFDHTYFDTINKATYHHMVSFILKNTCQYAIVDETFIGQWESSINFNDVKIPFFYLSEKQADDRVRKYHMTELKHGMPDKTYMQGTSYDPSKLTVGTAILLLFRASIKASAVSSMRLLYGIEGKPMKISYTSTDNPTVPKVKNVILMEDGYFNPRTGKTISQEYMKNCEVLSENIFTDETSHENLTKMVKTKSFGDAATEFFYICPFDNIFKAIPSSFLSHFDEVKKKETGYDNIKFGNALYSAVPSVIYDRDVLDVNKIVHRAQIFVSPLDRNNFKTISFE